MVPMRRALITLCATAAACGPTRPAPNHPAPSHSLPLPPDAGGPPPGLAAAGPVERALYHADLFDAARLLGDAPARALLGAELGLDGPPRGEAATRQVLDTLSSEAARAGLPGLAAALGDDLAELDGGDPLAIAAHRRALAAAPGEGAAAHALLSLYASCVRPLVDAANAPPWRRAAIADRCLYPLYDVDPTPWFGGDAELRPPDPPWSRFLDGLGRLLAELRARAPRFGRLADLLSADLQRFAEQIDRDGLAPPDLARLAPRLPAGAGALPPYDREAWVIVEDNMAVVGRAKFTTRDHLLVEKVERVLAMQRLTAAAHARVALFVPAEGSADVVDSLGELARRGGADSIELVLAAPLRLAPTPDGPWGPTPPDRRFVVLPLGLRAAAGRDAPRALSEKAGSLTLLVAPEGTTVLAKEGAFALGDNRALGPRLAELKRAFPDEAQVALAIDPTAGYRDVVAAALAARAAFGRVALVDVPHAPVRDELLARFRRRAAARLDVRGAGNGPLQRRAIALRGCYLDALDRDPAIAGAVTVLPGSPPALADGGPADPTLRECLAHRAGALGAKAPVTLDLSPR
jgi:hypothetical protein